MMFTYKGGKDVDLFKPTYVIMHHSLTKDGEVVDWQAFRRYHVNTLGWTEVGYHYGVEIVNAQYEILLGRLEGTQGAHCRQDSMNRKSIGICLTGNFDNYRPDLAQWSMALELAANICIRYAIPAENVKGHREYAPYKSCPGNLFNMEEFREDISTYIT